MLFYGFRTGIPSRLFGSLILIWVGSGLMLIATNPHVDLLSRLVITALGAVAFVLGVMAAITAFRLLALRIRSLLWWR